MDNTYFHNRSELIIVNENRVGRKKKVQLKNNLCENKSDCNLNENCLNGYCTKDITRFESSQTKKYKQIGEYYLYFKINTNYKFQNLFETNRLVLYPNENYNTIQIQNIFKDYIYLNQFNNNEVFKVINGILNIENSYECFYNYYCVQNKMYNFTETNNFKDFTEFEQKDNLLEKVYFSVRGIIVENKSFLVHLTINWIIFPFYFFCLISFFMILDELKRFIWFNFLGIIKS